MSQLTVGNIAVSGVGTMGSLRTDNVQLASGANHFTRPGQIMEYLTSPCDGSVVTGISGTYTWPSVPGQQTLSASYQTLSGSSISYVPPAGASKVVYRFNFGMRWENDHAITHHRFLIDETEVLWARQNRSGRYPEDKISFEWTINIGGTANTSSGRQASWTSPKTLSVSSRWYGVSNNRNAHGTHYWDGTGSNQFVMPTLTLIAIA
jgi:hypothetical protein